MFVLRVNQRMMQIVWIYVCSSDSCCSWYHILIIIQCWQKLQLIKAAELVALHSNGVDINCGCPQKWAINEGIGAALMKKPELVSDVIRQVKRRTCSVKMVGGTFLNFKLCKKSVRIKQKMKRDIRHASKYLASDVNEVEKIKKIHE